MKNKLIATSYSGAVKANTTLIINFQFIATIQLNY